MNFLARNIDRSSSKFKQKQNTNKEKTKQRKEKTKTTIKKDTRNKNKAKRNWTNEKPEKAKNFTRRVPLVEQELPTLPEHLSSPPGFSRVHVTRSLALCVCFVDRCLSFCTFSFGHYVVCSSINKGNNKITELRTILQRESPNS